MTQSELFAAGRHVATYAAGAATAFGVLHVLSAGDAANAVTAVNEISDGVGKLFMIAAPLVGIVSGWFASHSATPKAQIAAAQAADPAAVIQAVNVADNGVKVVSATTPGAMVSTPQK